MDSLPFYILRQFLFLTSYSMTGIEDKMVTAHGPLTRVATFTLVGEKKNYVGSSTEWKNTYAYKCVRQGLLSITLLLLSVRERKGS